jgi:DNA polymerase (family 10)
VEEDVSMLEVVHSTRRKLDAPLRNNEVADRFDDIETMLELSGANPFRVRAYRNASRLLRRYRRGQETAGLTIRSSECLALFWEPLAARILDVLR